MHDLNQIDETFDINQSNNYFLALQSSKSGFTYFITDTVRNKCVLMRHYRCLFENWQDYQNFLGPVLDKDEYLQLPYKKIAHILNSPEFTIVPESFKPESNSDIQTFARGFVIEDSYKLLTDTNKEAKSIVLFHYPKSFDLLLRKKFTNIKLSHQTVPLIHNILNESGRSLRHVVHLLIHPGFITISIAHSGSIDYINTFRTESNDDIIFYALSILELFKIVPSLAEIFVTNEMEAPDSINEKLKTYIGKVRSNKPPQNIVYSYAISEDSLNRFANLINLFNCG
jgi:hypothetical protein